MLLHRDIDFESMRGLPSISGAAPTKGIGYHAGSGRTRSRGSAWIGSHAWRNDCAAGAQDPGGQDSRADRLASIVLGFVLQLVARWLQ
jgi:hypothetical protein